MVIFGQRLFGRVDDVPGLFYVATQFFHINYLPLFPTQSWMVFEGSENTDLNQASWRGHQIPMSFKSVLVGWLRAALVIMAIITTVGAIAFFESDRASAWISIALTIGSIGAFYGSKRLFRASVESAKSVVRQSGLPQESIDQLIAIIDQRLEAVVDLPDGAV